MVRPWLRVRGAEPRRSRKWPIGGAPARAILAPAGALRLLPSPGVAMTNELDIFVGNTTLIDEDVYRLWLDGYSGV